MNLARGRGRGGSRSLSTRIKNLVQHSRIQQVPKISPQKLKMVVAGRANRRDGAQLADCSHRCMEMLLKHKIGFSELIHSTKKGTVLPKINYVAQNNWILQNIFDAQGNYQFCQKYVQQCLKVSNSRLSKLRKRKRELTYQPNTSVSKSLVSKKELRNVGKINGVIIPPEISPDAANIREWWNKLPETEPVQILRNDYRHGLTGKDSNRAAGLENIKKDFFEFIILHRTPSGREEGSRGPKYFLCDSFTRIRDPKQSELSQGRFQTEKEKERTLVYAFNKCQTSRERGVVAGATAERWMKELPDTVIGSHKTDYCDRCAELKNEIAVISTLIRRTQQSGNVDATSATSLLDRLKVSTEQLKNHRYHAAQAHAVLLRCIKTCQEHFYQLQLLKEVPQVDQTHVKNVTNSFLEFDGKFF